MSRANLVSVVLTVKTDVGSIRMAWDDAESLLKLTDPATPSRSVREIAQSVCERLGKLSRDEERDQ